MDFPLALYVTINLIIFLINAISRFLSVSPWDTYYAVFINLKLILRATVIIYSQTRCSFDGISAVFKHWLTVCSKQLVTFNSNLLDQVVKLTQSNKFHFSFSCIKWFKSPNWELHLKFKFAPLIIITAWHIFNFQV